MKHDKADLRILVVDDAADTRELLKRNLESKGYRIHTAPGAVEAIELLTVSPIDLVITDLKMPRVNGLELVRHIRDNCRDTEVMLITGYPSIKGAVEAVKTGAEAYLVKPFTDDELFAAVDQALAKLRIKRAGRDNVPGDDRTFGLVGDSEPVREVRAAIAKAAATTATVLISGESGTGKELAARAIHYSGANASAAFVAVNCSAIPEALLEGELFGYMKGAFTGAVETRAGFFLVADGGTLFLDEIGNTSPSMQAKLLRVLEDKQVTMIGSRKSRTVDVRIAAATNRDLRMLMAKGLFREDLFYRLNVITITLPPLRERGNDIIMLLRHYAAVYAAEYSRPVPEFADNALGIFREYPWPGNVRELANMVKSLVIMTDGRTIDVPDLPALMRYSINASLDTTRTLDEVESEYIMRVLESVNGNKTQAAAILGIDRKTLREKLKKHSGI